MLHGGLLSGSGSSKMPLLRELFRLYFSKTSQGIGGSTTETGLSSILLLGNRCFQNGRAIGFVHDENAEFEGAADVTRAHAGVVELTPEIGISVLVELRPGISQGVDFDIGGWKPLQQ